MLKTVLAFLLGAAALGLAVLLFSLELPVVALPVLLLDVSMKHVLGAVTGAALFAAALQG
ncbi:MAG: hypothetical protein SVU88_01245 [Candidatus Nanohaloarchaea archaeon]|nr:hypothetical protein [Candidatus Nanohaloarchaea archaeon]